MNISSPRLVTTAVWIALLLFSSGCGRVYVSQPIGEKPHVLNAAGWEGSWLVHPELDKKPFTLRVKVTEANEGRLQLSYIEEDAASVKIIQATVRESGTARLLFVTIPSEEGKPDCMVWGCVGRGEDLALVWVPDATKFGTLVRDGKLKGKLVDKDVFLEPPTAGELKALVSDALGLPFFLGAPAVFHRVAR